jgi:hypothetical protein
MSYMGYYFYPDAMDSIDDKPDVPKKRRAGRAKALSIAAGSGNDSHRWVRRHHKN